MDEFDAALNAVDAYTVPEPQMRDGWSSMTWPAEPVVSPDTGVEVETLRAVGHASVAIPAGFVRLISFHALLLIILKVLHMLIGFAS